MRRNPRLRLAVARGRLASAASSTLTGRTRCLAGLTGLRDSRLGTITSGAVEWLFKRPTAIHEYCTVRRVDRAAQIA